MKNVQLPRKSFRFLPKKPKVIFTLVLGFAFVSFTASAQSDGRGSRVKAVPTHQSIFNDLTIKRRYWLGRLLWRCSTQRPAIKTFVERELQFEQAVRSFFGAGIRMQFGEMAGKRDYYHLSNGQVNPNKPVFETFENHYFNLDVTGSIHFGALLKQQTHNFKNNASRQVAVFDPYIFAGVGGIFYNVEVATTYDRTENSEIPETTLRSFNKQRDVTIPIGAGIKYYVTSKWSLGAEGVYKFVPSDMLDGTFRRYYQSQKEFVNDRFSYIGFNLGYTFRYK